jgi:hypothetical protein
MQSSPKDGGGRSGGGGGGERKRARDAEAGPESGPREEETQLEEVRAHAEVCLNRFVLVPLFQSVKCCACGGSAGRAGGA